MKTLRTLNVGQLKQLLDGYDDDQPVIFTANYGDYSRTEQALPLRGFIEESRITKSAYSDSGFTLSDEDSREGMLAEEEDAPMYLVIK